MTRIPRRLAGVGAAADLPNAAAFDAYIGPSREVVLDTARGIIAVHDGFAPGGMQFKLRNLLPDGGTVGQVPVKVAGGEVEWADQSGSASAAYAPGALFGGTLSNNVSDSSNDINIAPVKCRDLDDSGNIVIPATITKRLDATWAAGNNNGGLDTGTKQVNATYHVFAIRNPTTLVTDVVFSASAVSPVMPSGFTQKRRLGGIMTDASGNIRGFVQTGGWFYLTGVTPGALHENVAISTAVKLKMRVPTGIKVIADVTALLSGGSGNGFLAMRDPDVGTAAIYDGVASGPSLVTGGQILCWTNTLGEISFFGSSAGALVNVYSRGWYDGRDTYI